jgi:hypothetical protein
MRLPRQKKLYKRGILMEDDFVAGASLQNPKPSTSFNKVETSAWNESS